MISDRPVHPKRSSERGFTLMELVVASAVGFLVVTFTMIFYTGQQESITLAQQIRETQQNGRAGLALLKRVIRLAGHGFYDSKVSIGQPAIGTCWDDGTPQNFDVECDAKDTDGDAQAFPEGMDRLRVVYMQPTRFVELTAGQHPAPADTQLINVDLADPLDVNDIAVISGPCDGLRTDAAFPGTPQIEVAHDLVRITSVSPGTPGNNYQFDVINDTPFTGGCIHHGHQFGASTRFGRAFVRDFWIDRADPDDSVLRMRTLAHDGTAYNLPTEGDIVAHHIDDLQFRFLVDDDIDTPDNVLNLFSNAGVLTPYACDTVYHPVWGPDELVCNSNPPNILGIASVKRMRRFAFIRAVEIAVVPRSASIDSDRVSGSPTQFTVMNHHLTGYGDGYRRWIYRSVVNLRNTEL